MIKIKTGFNENQYYIIEDQEAHKAYYLFNNPEARTVFTNGVALIGKNIQEIQPAYNETMGWNPTHKLDDDDWNEIRSKGVADRLRNVLALGREVALLAEQKPEILKIPLREAKQLLLN